MAPKPPCCKSFAEKATLGVPRLANVADILSPQMKDFPTPITKHFPLAL